MRRELRARFGEGADVRAVTRDGARVHVEGIEIPIRHGRVTVSAALALAGGAIRVLDVDARARLELEPLGVVHVHLRYVGRAPEGHGIVATGDVQVRVRAERLASPLVLGGRVLVDGSRLYVSGGEGSGPGLALRIEGSLARSLSDLRVRARGDLELAPLLAAWGVPEVGRPRAGDTFAFVAEVSGAPDAPEVRIDAAADVLAFAFGRPRWVPPPRLTDARVFVRKAGEDLRVTASARAGAGRVELEGDGGGARLVLDAFPASFVGAALHAPPEERARIDRALAEGTVDGRAEASWATRTVEGEIELCAAGSRVALAPLRCSLTSGDPRGTRVVADVGLAELIARIGAGVTGTGSVHVVASVTSATTADVHVTSPAIEVTVGKETFSVTEIDVASVVTRGEPLVALAIAPGAASARAFGGVWSAEGAVRFGGAEPSGELRVCADGCDGTMLATAVGAAARAPRIRVAPTEGTRAPFEIWLPRDLRLAADATVRVARAPSLSMHLSATTATCALEADVEASSPRRFAATVRGRLAIAEAIDLALFDGGAGLPERRGRLEVSLAIDGGDLVHLAGDLRADRLAFTPEVELEEVRALLATRGAVAIWHEVEARLAGGRIALSALVDRDGPIGGMRGHVVADGVALEPLSKRVVGGRLSAELALEQHGPEDAPVFADGKVLAADVALRDPDRVRAPRVPPAVLARNARAAGPVTARVNLDAGALRVVDLHLPLPDGHVEAAVRLGFDRAIEAHVDVVLRGLLALPLRVRGRADAPDVDVDVLGAALAGVAAARMKTREVRSRHVDTTVARHPALEAAVASVDWAAVRRRARRR